MLIRINKARGYNGQEMEKGEVDAGQNEGVNLGTCFATGSLAVSARNQGASARYRLEI